MSDPRRALLPSLALIAAASLAGCATPPESGRAADEPAAKAVVANNDDLYEARHEGRLYLFDDRQVFRDFLAHGETPYRLTRIGAGPGGETLVFGLRDEDKKKSGGIGAVDLYDGKLAPAPDFYGEMHLHERIYVFNSLEDMAAVRATGHPAYMYTEIGAGPDGRTVVYVLNDANKKRRPDAMIARFKARNP